MKNKNEVIVVLLGIIISLVIHFILPKLTSPSTPTPLPKTPMPNLSRNLNSQLKTLWCPERDFPFLESMKECCDWIPVADPKNATILWTIGKSDLKISLEKLKLGGGQLWNQIHSGGMMTDKSRLHKLLVNINATYFQPETYVLTDPEECKKFFSGPGIEPGVVWVTKDPLSAEGDGIIINPDVAKLKEMWVEEGENGDFKCKTPTTDSVLIQRYVMNPLLLEGKKMEIRSYWMVASIDPFIILYRDGTVRLTTRDYKSGEWNDPLIHITNTKQQKLADPDYHITESERKWTLQQLADYLFKKGKIQSPTEWLNEMRIKFKYIIGRCVKGVYPELLQNLKKYKKGKWDGRFEIFGMDVILDENLRPWLTELQDGPSLSMDPGPKRHLIPEMLSELVDIVLEVDYAHRFNDHNVPYPLQSMGKWEYVDTENFHHHNGDL